MRKRPPPEANEAGNRVWRRVATGQRDRAGSAPTRPGPRADGTPLAAVLINPRNRPEQEALDRIRAWAEADATHDSWFALAVTLQQQGKHQEAARAFAIALQFESRPVDRTARDYHDKGGA